MIKCKIFTMFSNAQLPNDGEEKVAAWLNDQPEELEIVAVAQSSSTANASGVGLGVKTTLTVFYR